MSRITPQLRLAALTVATLATVASVAMAQYGPSHGADIDPNTGEPYLSESELANLMREQTSSSGAIQRGLNSYGPNQAQMGRSASHGRGLHQASSHQHKRHHDDAYHGQNMGHRQTAGYAPPNSYSMGSPAGSPYGAGAGAAEPSERSQYHSGFGRGPAAANANYDDDSSNNNNEGMYAGQGANNYERSPSSESSANDDGDDDGPAAGPMQRGPMRLSQAASHQGAGYHGNGNGESEAVSHGTREGPLNAFGDSIDAFNGPEGDSEMNAMVRGKADGSSAADSDDEPIDARSTGHGYQHDSSAPLVNVRKGPAGSARYTTSSGAKNYDNGGADQGATNQANDSEHNSNNDDNDSDDDRRAA